MKKYIALALALILCFSLFLVPTAHAEEKYVLRAANTNNEDS